MGLVLSINFQILDIGPVSRTSLVKDAPRQLFIKRMQISGSPGISPKMTMAEFLKSWLECRTNLEDTTISNYRGSINRMLPFLGQIQLGKVKAGTIEELYKILDGKYAAGPILNTHAVLKMAFDRAERLGDLPINPMKNVKRPSKKSRSIPPIPEQDFTKIYLEATKHASTHALMELLGVSGPRINEALALTWDDVDFDTQTLTISSTMKRNKDGVRFEGDTKTHQSLVKPLSETQCAILWAHKLTQDGIRSTYRNDLNLVFPDSNGAHKDERNQRREWSALLIRANVKPYTLHQLRKTAMTRMSIHTSPAVLRAFSVDKSVATTLKYYAQPEEAAVREALEKVDEKRNGKSSLVNLEELRARKTG
jgi:integrase